jgi:uncharacterized protein (TIGR03382 family)
MTVQASLQALREAMITWNEAGAQNGAFVAFQLDEPMDNLKRSFNPVGLNRNVVVWLTDRWGNDEEDYSPLAVAVTTLTFIADPGAPDDGEILDADIEFNGIHQTFSAEPDGEPGKHDVQNTLTHELGHVLGLDHTCHDGEIFPRPVDHNGNPVPDCQPASDLPDEVKNATMYNYSVEGEIDKRSLEPDDIQGLQTIYPLARDPKIYSRVDFTQKTCGCSAGSNGNPGLPIPLALGLLLWMALSRTRRSDR